MNKVKKADYDHIFVVDDDQMVLDALVRSLATLQLKVSAFTSAHDCLQRLRSEHCTILITDINMPEISGLDLVARAHKLHAHLPIIVMTGYADIPTAVKSMKLGAKEFLEKPFEEQVFLELVTKFSSLRACAGGYENKLGPAELALLKLIVEGRSNKEAAFLLKKSVRTVENQRRQLCQKLAAHSTADLVRIALEQGLV